MESEKLLQKKNDLLARQSKKIKMLNKEYKALYYEIDERKEQYQTFMNSTDDIVFLKDSKLRYVLVNTAQKEFFGKEVSEIMGKIDFDLMPPEMAKNCSESDRLALKENKTIINTEHTLNGIYETRKFPVKLSKNETGVGAFIRDITQQKNAEDALEESRKNYWDLFNNAPVGYHEVDSNGKIISVNNTELEMLGYSKEEMIGKPVWDFAKNQELARISVQKKLKGEKPESHLKERAYKKKDGDILDILIDENFTYDEYRNVAKIRTTIQDISELRNAEEEIKKLTNAVEQSPISIFITDIKGSIQYVNQRVTELTLYEKEELLGQNPRIFSSGNKPKKEYEILWKTITSGKVWNGEFLNKKKNGELYWESASISPVVNNKGEITNFIGIQQDITQLKKLNDQLRKAKEKAEESDRLKTAFLANISHEIRTPMNGILGFAELLKDPDLTGEKQQDFIQLIEESGDRMLNIINDIVDISKIEAGQVEIKEEETDLNKLIKEIYNFFNTEAYNKKLDFKYLCSLPDTNCKILVDPNKLSQILTNLVKNAFKFTLIGSIKFGYYHKNNKLRFFVSDTGKGILNEEKEVIFQRFSQGNNAMSRKHEGAGLGLSISKSYVDMMDGNIWVESELDVGSTFFFEIPYNPVKEPIIQKTSDKEEKGIIEGLTILIADDDELSMFFLNEILRNKAKKVIAVKNGNEAVDIIKSGTIVDLILMDLKMPVMDGFEATKLIKQINPDIPIIAQTAFAFSDDESKALQAGCDDYISKPIKRSLLLEKINSICSK